MIDRIPLAIMLTIKKENSTTKYFIDTKKLKTDKTEVENHFQKSIPTPYNSSLLSQRRNHAYRMWYDVEKEKIHEILQHFSVLIEQIQNNKYFEFHFQPIELLKSIIHFIYRTSPSTHPLKINYQKLSS